MIRWSLTGKAHLNARATKLIIGTISRNRLFHFAEQMLFGCSQTNKRKRHPAENRALFSAIITMLANTYSHFVRLPCGNLFGGMCSWSDHSKIRTSACGNPSAGRKCEREGESESLRINSFDRNNQVDFHYQVPLSCLAHLPSHRCCRTIIVNLLGLRRVACCSFPAGMRACVGIFFCTPSLLGSPPVACFPSSPEQFRHADTWMARVT